MPFCVTCKSKLDPVVSNTKSPNEYRIRIYICKSCSQKEGIAVIQTITTKSVTEKNIWKTINVDIFKTQKM